MHLLAFLQSKYPYLSPSGGQPVDCHVLISRRTCVEGQFLRQFTNFGLNPQNRWVDKQRGEWQFTSDESLILENYALYKAYDVSWVHLAAELLSVFISGQALPFYSSFSYYYNPTHNMTTLPQTKAHDSSIPDYIDEDPESITAEKRENRARLDELVDRVHESHSWFLSPRVAVDSANCQTR